MASDRRRRWRLCADGGRAARSAAPDAGHDDDLAWRRRRHHVGGDGVQQSGDKQANVGGWPLRSPNPNAHRDVDAARLDDVSRRLVGLAPSTTTTTTTTTTA
jgi:hypothetical protein